MWFQAAKTAPSVSSRNSVRTELIRQETEGGQTRSLATVYVAEGKWHNPMTIGVILKSVESLLKDPHAPLTLTPESLRKSEQELGERFVKEFKAEPPTSLSEMLSEAAVWANGAAAKKKAVDKARKGFKLVTPDMVEPSNPPDRRTLLGSAVGEQSCPDCGFRLYPLQRSCGCGYDLTNGVRMTTLDASPCVARIAPAGGQSIVWAKWSRVEAYRAAKPAGDFAAEEDEARAAWLIVAAERGLLSPATTLRLIGCQRCRTRPGDPYGFTYSVLEGDANLRAKGIRAIVSRKGLCCIHLCTECVQQHRSGRVRRRWIALSLSAIIFAISWVVWGQRPPDFDQLPPEAMDPVFLLAAIGLMVGGIGVPVSALSFLTGGTADRFAQGSNLAVTMCSDIPQFGRRLIPFDSDPNR